MNRRLYVDFEYNGTKEAKLNLVCACTMEVVEGGETVTRDWWLHKNADNKQLLWEYLQSFEGDVISFNAEAEARSMISLGIDPLQFSWVDLFLEYRMLQNHNHDLAHGKQLIDGKVKTTYPFGEKGKQNLAAAVYKMTGKIIDTDHKEKMRELIISAPEEFTPEEQKVIQEYCKSDVLVLPELREKISIYYGKKIHKKELKKIKAEARLRAEYAVRTAKMVSLGYPVNLEWLNNFASNVPSVMEEAARDIITQFKEPPFYWNRSTGAFSLATKVVKDWIVKTHGDDWELTEKGGISLALEAFEKKYTYKHDYPRGNMAAQMIRYKKLEQAMRGFNRNAEKTIFNDLGSDGRVRAYLNPYGAQSSRTQPGSTSFIFLKPAWQRSVVQPRKGRAICGLDFSSQEFLLSALVSRDSKMLEAYRSGDVYLAFGKMIGWIPQSGTKKTHKFERDCCKAVVLGLSYLMSKIGLARKLSTDTGKVFTEDQAQELIEQFNETFQDFSEWRRQAINNYRDEGYVKLPCGWYMFGDNPNDRSVGNIPIQGLGASIMRKAVALAQDRGLDIIFTLHDAIYIEYDSFDFMAIQKLKDCMVEAFTYYFEGEMINHAKMIRIEGETWSPDYKKDVAPLDFPVVTESIHIDERAVKEYELFSKYFTTKLGDELL